MNFHRVSVEFPYFLVYVPNVWMLYSRSRLNKEREKKKNTPIQPQSRANIHSNKELKMFKKKIIITWEKRWHNYQCASRFMTDARTRSKTMCALSDDWEDEPDDDAPFIKLIASSDTDSDCGLTKKSQTRVTGGKKSLNPSSPWRFEKRGSSISSASSTGAGKKTPTNKRRLSNIGVNCKNTYLSKNSPYKTNSMKKNSANLSRSRCSTTGKKYNSKYTWSGIFNEKRAKRSIFTYGNETFTQERKHDETVIDTLTRSSSPVDEKFYYSSDSEIEARVFGLKNHSGSGSWTFREADDTLCEKSQGNDFYGQRIVDPDIGENIDRRNCKKSISNDRTGSIFGLDLLKQTRIRSGLESESTLRASNGGGSRKSSISRNNNSVVRQTSVREMRIVSKSFQLDDKVFEIEAQSDCPVFQSTADFWVDDEIPEKHNLSQQTDDPTINNDECVNEPNSTIVQSLRRTLLTLLKNVILFSILPTAYIAFFLYVQTRDQSDGDLY